jgi:hypothetical protein
MIPGKCIHTFFRVLPHRRLCGSIWNNTWLTLQTSANLRAACPIPQPLSARVPQKLNVEDRALMPSRYCYTTLSVKLRELTFERAPVQ